MVYMSVYSSLLSLLWLMGLLHSTVLMYSHQLMVVVTTLIPHKSLHYNIVSLITVPSCMRIDTGQQLDIVYTTESLLIVTPKDGHTSMVIAKINDELPCLKHPNTTNDDHKIQFVQTIIGLLTILVSNYILIVHLLFKELRRALFGKLLMFYNICMVCRGIGALAIQLMHYLIVVNSQAICHTTTIIFALTFSSSEIFATDILYHSAYIMYRCYHLKSEISKKRSEYLFRHYTGYAGFTLILLFFVTIAYDWRNGIGKYTILENGHCSFVNTSSYNTLFLTIFIITINKFLQLMMFIAYLFYLYKFNLNVRAAQVTLRYSRLLFRIAIAMGAAVGLSFFIFTLVVFIPEYSDITFISGAVIELIQQIVIMTTFMCTKKVYTLCKGCFSMD